MDYHAGIGARVDESSSMICSATRYGTLNANGIAIIDPIANSYANRCQ